MKIEESTCICIKCNKELFKGYRKKGGLRWDIRDYKNNALYLPNVGWLCLNHFSREGLIHEKDVKYYSYKVYLLNKRVYVDERLTFRDDTNLRVYELKPSKPINHFWGSYEEIRERDSISRQSEKDMLKKKIWII
ncbi:MAG: hypothetical protein ACE5K4_11635 [Candidatus Hydrothermarchaeota archaeon]